MKQVVLDTDIMSYIADGRFPEVIAIGKQYIRVFRYFTVTSISVFEAVRGLEYIESEARLASFLERVEGFEVLDFSVEEALLAGKISSALKRYGQSIGVLDPLIAAVAIRAGLPLATNNRRHYQLIVDLGFDLELEDWMQSG